MTGKSSTLKWVSLLTLVVQNSSLVLMMRYSRTLSSTSSTTSYLPSTAVVCAEVLKFCMSFVLYAMEESGDAQNQFSLASVTTNLLGPNSGWLYMTVPAILYFIQNNLQYHAVSMLDAATFQVTYQMKILTTALFSVLLLKKSLSVRKWLSLLVLTMGIAIVQVSNANKPAAATDADEEENSSNAVLGLLAVACACFLSGLAGVWFEKVLKGSQASVFLRNMQLSLFSVIPGLIFGVFIMDREKIALNGFFGGYTFWTWATIANQAIGGLIVAMVVKYADNILKGFATSISIILSCLASMVLFDFQVTWMFIFGSSLVLLATQWYGLPDRRARLAKKTSLIPLVN